MNTTQTVLAATLRGGLRIIMASWATLTIANQVGRAKKTVTTVDPTGLFIPDWRFFAPVPATHEYRIMVRDQLTDGSMTSWNEHDLGLERRSSHTFWAPHRRMEKSVFDVTTELLRAGENATETQHHNPWSVIRSSTGYIAMLNEVVHRALHHEQAESTQFLLVRTAEYDDSAPVEPVLTSEMHRF